MFELDYTYGKAWMDQFYSFHKPYVTTEMNYTNIYTNQGGNATGNVRHTFVANWMYDLPFGRSRRFLSGAGGVMDWIVGGWSFQGVARLQSGRLIDFGNLFYYGNDYHDIVLPRTQRDRAHWFNTDNFERSSSKGPNSYHRRVFPTRFDFLRADYMNQLDMSLMREFSLAAHTKLQLRVDAINALNNVQWDRPNTSPTSSSFGVVTQQWNTPRWVQVQGRFTF
jgi:hypothetical protein